MEQTSLRRTLNIPCPPRRRLGQWHRPTGHGIEQPPEQRIIRLLIEGASNDQMAADLYMSVASVKRKLRNIFTKLRVQNRAQAAAVIVQRNLI